MQNLIQISGNNLNNVSIELVELSGTKWENIWKEKLSLKHWVRPKMSETYVEA